MKFFSRSWAGGKMKDREASAVARAYQTHVDEILPDLPATVQTIARGVNIHDGLIRSIQVNRRPGTLILRLRCGDLQGGYFDLDLRYSSVDFTSSNLADLAAIAADERTEALYDEVDRTESAEPRLAVHRILFWPRGEIEIVFGALALSLVPTDGREFARPAEVYAENDE